MSEMCPPFGSVHDWYNLTPAEATVVKILNEELLSEDRIGAVRELIRHDIHIAKGAVRFNWVDMATTLSVPDDKVYRVSIVPDGVNAICFGLEGVDSTLDGHYDSVDALPKWVKERLAVLMITPSAPPTYEVEGVGRRISSHVYWVYAPDSTS